LYGQVSLMIRSSAHLAIAVLVAAWLHAGCVDDRCANQVLDQRGDLTLFIHAKPNDVQSVGTAGACAGARVDCIRGGDARVSGFQKGCELYAINANAAGKCTLTILRASAATFEQNVYITDVGPDCHGNSVFAFDPSDVYLP